MITQLAEDTVIAGRLIPKGYVNATEICKANKKKLDNYFRLKSTKAFIEETSAVTSHLRERLIITIIGGNEKELQGTWVHINIALHLSQWISPRFAAWAAETLNLVLRGDYQALTKAATEAQQQLRKLWEEIRLDGKVARRSVTDAIKDYCIKYNVRQNYPGQIYAIFSDKINVAIFGMTAQQLRLYRGIETISQLLRDSHDKKDLSKIADIEKYSQIKIDKYNVHPLKAVDEAIDFYS